MLKSLTFLYTLLFCLNINAMTFSETVASDYNHYVTGHIGIDKGGLGIGVDYERKKDRLYNWGGYARMMPKGDSANGITALGVFVRPHHYERNWNFYLSPGFGLAMIDAASNETALGPSISYGALYQLNNKFAVGFDNMKIYSWTGSNYKGYIADLLLISLHYPLP